MADANLNLGILVSANTQQASGAFSGLSSMIGAVFSSGGPAGLAIGAVAALGAAVVGVAEKSVNLASGFEQSMNKVQALTGSSSSQMKSYSDQIIGLSNDTGVSATKLSDGLYNVMSAGFQGSDAMKVLSLSTKDAVIGMTDSATTSNALTTVIKAFGVSVKDADSVNGEMLKTVTDGKMSMADYAGAIGKGSVTAQQYKVSMEDMNSSIATLTANGVPSARQAVTDFDAAVKTMYGNINTVSGSLHKNGIAFDEAKFNTLDYQGKTNLLAAALDEANKKHVTIHGVTAQAAQDLQILSQHSKEYSKDLKSMKDKQDDANTTTKAWDVTQKGFNVTMSKLKTSTDNMMLSLGMKLLPVLSKLGNDIAPVIQHFADWITKSGAADKVASSLSTTIDLMIAGFKEAWPTIQNVAKALFDFGNDIGTRLMPTINNVVQFFKENWPAISTIVGGVWKIIKGDFEVFWSLFSGIVKISLDLLTGNWKQAWTDIVDMLKGMFKGMKDVVGGQIQIVTGMVDGILVHFGLMKDGVTQKTEDMKAQTALKTAAMKATSIMHTEQMAMGSIKNIEKQKAGILAQISQTTDPVKKKMLEMKLGSLNEMEQQEKGVVKHADQQRKATVEKIQKMRDDAIEAHKSMYEKSIEWIGKLKDNVFSTVSRLWKDVIAFIQVSADKVVWQFSSMEEKAVAYIDNMDSTIKDKITSLVTDAESFGSNLVNNFINGLKSQLGNVANTASNIAKTVEDYIGFHSPSRKGPGSQAHAWAPNLVKMFADDITASIPKATTAAESFIKKVSAVMSGSIPSANSMSSLSSSNQNFAYALSPNSTASSFGSGFSAQQRQQNTTIEIHIQGNVIGNKQFAKDIADLVSEEQSKQLRRTWSVANAFSGGKA